MRRTKKAERETIEAYKDMTAYFSGEISRREISEMFRYRFGFGDAETRVIVAALSLAGGEMENRIKRFQPLNVAIGR